MMMLKQLKTLSVLVILTLLIGCKSAETKQKTEAETTAYKALTEKWGNTVKYDFNKGRSYVLAQSVPSAKSSSTGFSYFVYDMKAEKVTIRGEVDSGYIKWLSEKEVEIFRTPGVMAPNTTRDDYTEVVDVVSGKSTPKKNWSK